MGFGSLDGTVFFQVGLGTPLRTMPFHTTDLFLYPWKHQKNRFSAVFRWYRKRPVVWNGLVNLQRDLFYLIRQSCLLEPFYEKFYLDGSGSSLNILLNRTNLKLDNTLVIPEIVEKVIIALDPRCRDYSGHFLAVVSSKNIQSSI